MMIHQHEQRQARPTTLEACLGAFEAEEQLGESEAWYVHACVFHHMLLLVLFFGGVGSIRTHTADTYTYTFTSI